MSAIIEKNFAYWEVKEDAKLLPNYLNVRETYDMRRNLYEKVDEKISRESGKGRK